MDFQGPKDGGTKEAQNLIEKNENLFLEEQEGLHRPRKKLKLPSQNF